MFTVSICIECLHRILKGKLLWTTWLSSWRPQQKWRKEVSKKKTCVKIMCELQMFQTVTVWWESTFLTFISNRSPEGDVNVLSEIPVLSFLMSMVLAVWCQRQTEPDGLKYTWLFCCHKRNTMLHNSVKLRQYTSENGWFLFFFFNFYVCCKFTGIFEREGVLQKNKNTPLCWKMLFGCLFFLLSKFSLISVTCHHYRKSIFQNPRPSCFGLCVPALALMISFSQFLFVEHRAA